MSAKKIIVLSAVLVVAVVGIFLYNNFNRLLSEALLRSFDSNIASDVYELKFEKLSVNPFEGSIRVSNVVMQPREKPLQDYPYINSSFRLKTEKLMLINVEIFDLLRSSQLNLERILITKPDIDLVLVGKNPVLFPFKDTTTTADQPKVPRKKFLEAFSLKEFQLIDASFHVSNSGKQREFKIQKFNISLEDLLISQQPGEDLTSFKQVNLSIGELTGRLQKGPISQVSLKNYNIKIDSLEIQKTIDTLTFQFNDFTTGLRDLDIQTADSIFHLTLQSFSLSYQDKSIQLKEVSFMPNVGHAVLQRDHQFQHTEFSGSVGLLELNQVNFDSLMYTRKLLIDEIILDSVKAFIFKDKTKPLDPKRFPAYLGQTVAKIPLPLRINRVKATNVYLENTERKPDSTLAKVNITKATLEVNNITNLTPDGNLVMQADAFINDKAHFKARLAFYYSKPQFDFEGVVDEFDLPNLNPLIQAYTPAKINKGRADKISFSGIAKEKGATGSMEFLYHDLEVDLELKEQAKWKSAVIAFAANAVTNSSNPESSDLPPRKVKFNIERDMNKGFVSVVIKSILNGLKETMLMSKENRKKYKKEVEKSSKKNNK